MKTSNYAEIAKALYRINKQAKAYRDAYNHIRYNEVTDEDIDNLEGILKDYPYAAKCGRIGVRNQWDTIYTDKDDAYRDLSDDPDYWSDYELEDIDEDEYTPEQLEEMKEYSREAYAEYEMIEDGLNALYDIESDIKWEKDKLYMLKNSVLNSLIASGRFAVCGVHEFPQGDIRRCYDIEGFLFHGEDISEYISDEEYEQVEELDEIPADNKLAADMSLEQAMKILNEYKSSLNKQAA